MRITSFSVLEGERVDVYTRARFCVLCHFGTKAFASVHLKDLPPTQLCKEVSLCSCIVWCDGKRRFNSAALSKKKVLIFGVGGRVTSLQRLCEANIGCSRSANQIMMESKQATPGEETTKKIQDKIPQDDLLEEQWKRMNEEISWRGWK